MVLAVKYMCLRNKREIRHLVASCMHYCRVQMVAGPTYVNQKAKMKTCLCCSGSRKIKKGLWSPDEDACLADFIQSNGIRSWSLVPIEAGLDRCGKSCRLRWLNYLRPDLKRGGFSIQEQELIVSMHSKFGNRWSCIAKQLPGRSDNEVKNFCKVYFKKAQHVCPKTSSKAEKEECDNENVAVLNGEKSTVSTKAPSFLAWHCGSDPAADLSTGTSSGLVLRDDPCGLLRDDRNQSPDPSFFLIKQWGSADSANDFKLQQWSDDFMEDMDWNKIWGEISIK